MGHEKLTRFRFARVLATVLISVFTLCYGIGLLLRGPPWGWATINNNKKKARIWRIFHC